MPRESTADVPEALTAPRAAIDEHLAAFIDAREMPGSLREAIRYALLGGGKRVRPVLAWHAAAAAGGDASHGPSSLSAGAAVELVHAFSLVHDDLPAMDDDDMRRGRPTLHVHAGEAMAVLAGDAMLTLAFAALARPAPGLEGADAELPDRLRSALVEGTTGMIAGQIYDTLGGFPEGLDDAARLELVHRNKTGALLRAAAVMGGCCGAAAARVPRAEAVRRVTALDRYADAVGLMFQITDDLIDVEQSDEHAGKRTGKDADAGKLTYPSVLGVGASRRRLAELLEEAEGALAGFGASGEPLRSIAEYVAGRSR